VTASLLTAALLGSGILCAHLGRTAVLLALSYLALRRSEPAQRKEILEVLGPALGAVGAVGSLRPSTLTTRQRLMETPRLRVTRRYLHDTSR
jgi:hypothetical protein